MTIANTTAIVEAFLEAKAAFDAAEAALKIAKQSVVEAVGGYGFIEGQTADLDVAVQARSSISEELLKKFLTADEIKSCKIEGAAYPVVRVKAKKKNVA